LKVDGIKHPVDISYLQGLMEFILGSGEHVIELGFEATPIRVAGRILSILAFCSLIATAWMLQSRPKSTGG
jgi:hypothetical protein